MVAELSRHIDNYLFYSNTGTRKMTTPNYTNAPSVNPFDGDYGDGEETIIDVIVDAPRVPTCHACGNRIKPGTKIRHRIERIGSLDDGDTEIELHEYLWCETCVKAMASDNPDKFERRLEIGSARETEWVQREDRLDVGYDDSGDQVTVTLVRQW